MAPAWHHTSWRLSDPIQCVAPREAEEWDYPVSWVFHPEGERGGFGREELLRAGEVWPTLCRELPPARDFALVVVGVWWG